MKSHAWLGTNDTSDRRNQINKDRKWRTSDKRRECRNNFIVEKNFNERKVVGRRYGRKDLKCLWRRKSNKELMEQY